VRLAIISDIHSNLEALTAVLEDIEKRRADRVLCLGDVVGYGAEPGACLSEVRGRSDWILAGNHDWGAVGKVDLAYFNYSARAAAEWTGGQLAESERAFLSKLPLHRIWDGPEPSFLTVHSTPDRPHEWRYILSIDEAEYQFEQLQLPLCFVGHSHQPIVWRWEGPGKCSVAGREYLHIEPGKRYIVNVGSVGQPRDGDPRASYGLYDRERQEVIIHKVEYNIAAAQQKILRAGLPPRLAERLAHGV